MAGIQEAYIHGVSTRKVDELVQAMGMTGISKSHASKLCGELDEQVAVFLKRPLPGEWAYLWLDASDLRIRDNGRVMSKAVVVAVGVTQDGRLEVLGIDRGVASFKKVHEPGKSAEDHRARPKVAIRPGPGLGRINYAWGSRELYNANRRLV